MESAVDLVLPYDPFLAFKESIVDGQDATQPQTNLGRAYDALTDKVISANSGDVLTLLKQAAELKEEGTYELAELRYREVVEAKPDSVEAWFEFGKFERLKRNFASACECFEKAYALAPGDGKILSQLATTYVHVDKSKTAQYYRELVSREQDLERVMSVSTTLRNFGLVELSLEGFLKAASLAPTSEPAFFQLGQTYMQLKQYGQAADAYQRALELEPNDLFCIYNAGAALIRSGDGRGSEYFARAIGIWEKLDQKDYDLEELANYCEAMSNAYLAVGNADMAIRLLEKALDLTKGAGKGRIFSSTKYEYLPRERFVLDVRSRVENLRRRFG
jgi:tetratricopeptide (TPR) repeat protein